MSGDIRRLALQMPEAEPNDPDCPILKLCNSRSHCEAISSSHLKQICDIPDIMKFFTLCSTFLASCGLLAARAGLHYCGSNVLSFGAHPLRITQTPWLNKSSQEITTTRSQMHLNVQASP